MINPLEIKVPVDLNSALMFLSEAREDVHVIAGGTDVVTGLGQGSNRFKNAVQLVDVNHIPEMKGISVIGNTIKIGAAENFTSIIGNETIKEHLPLLAKACATIGSVQIRNRATIAGNFVNNAPCADTVPVLLAYDASIIIESSKGKREILLSDFLSAPYKTNLNRNELVTSINIPVPSKELKGDFYKLGRRRAVAISRITMALLVNVKDEKISEIRIASGAVTPIGKRFIEIEKSSTGKTADEDTLKDIASQLGEGILNVTGLRWSSEYKLPVVQQVFYQMLHKSVFGGSNGK
jgi:CO/xanthine dehydrogenase FAD-binding subunit